MQCRLGKLCYSGKIKAGRDECGKVCVGGRVGEEEEEEEEKGEEKEVEEKEENEEEEGRRGRHKKKRGQGEKVRRKGGRESLQKGWLEGSTPATLEAHFTAFPTMPHQAANVVYPQSQLKISKFPISNTRCQHEAHITLPSKKHGN
ncbi:hypothetical protein PoB_000773800 [Plakobranchus ocellatus]|uniref:Uncharacterized protein n=1 Tax=Plakobranchus ocellatus TaxID=259542 RepID=A0AAV3YGG7_9GAST|nr:hypothetical protein PoB_000773800 [Plakobranchus ocellatus]